jgi:hypothetical protein
MSKKYKGFRNWKPSFWLELEGERCFTVFEVRVLTGSRYLFQVSEISQFPGSDAQD